METVESVPANSPEAKGWAEICKGTGYWDLDFRLYGPGKMIFPKKYTEWADYIRNMEVREDDAWVATFPRCGTTWALEMVWLIVNDCNFEKARAIDLQQRAPYVEIDALFRAPSKWEEVDGQLRAVGLTTMDETEHLKSPRVIKTHLPLSLLPKDLIKGAKTVYVARNPKDACVSFYHQTVLINGYEGTMDEFADFFMANAMMYCPYWTHVEEFYRLRDDPNVLFITYEEMKENLQAVLEKTAKFFNKEISAEQMTELLDHLSFQSMKKNPSTNRESLVQEMYLLHGKQPKTEFIRKGKVGSWKEEMSEETIRKFDKWIEENKIEGLYC